MENLKSLNIKSKYKANNPGTLIEHVQPRLCKFYRNSAEYNSNGKIDYQQNNYKSEESESLIQYSSDKVQDNSLSNSNAKIPENNEDDEYQIPETIPSYKNEFVICQKGLQYHIMGNNLRLKGFHIEAFYQYKLANIFGNAEATCKLAQYYAEGIGTKRDINKAKRLFKKSAELKCASAERFLEKILETENDIKRDSKEYNSDGKIDCQENNSMPEKSESLIQDSSDKVQDNSLLNLNAKITENNEDYEEQIPKTNPYYKNKNVVCQKGSQYHKKGNNLRSEGFHIEAFYQYKLANIFGNAESTCKLAQYYAEGIGIKKDINKAKKLFKKSAELKYAIAERFLEKMKNDTENDIKSVSPISEDETD